MEIGEKSNIWDLVLLVEENLLIYKRPLGRIVEVYYGNDKEIHVVKIKTVKDLYEAYLKNLPPAHARLRKWKKKKKEEL